MDQELAEILDPRYLEGIDEVPVAEVRARRSSCQEVETALSYLRRIAQGRLDIVSTELERRSAGGDPGHLEDLIERLPEVLSDRTRGPGVGHLPTTLSPGPIEGALVEELAAMEVEATLTDLPGVSDAWLRTAQERLVAYDRKVSGLRRSLFDRIDALQHELGRRYRSGEASVDRLIADN
jgi:hypothetical protein